MLHKILHYVDHSIYCKLPQFEKSIRITRYTAQKNDKDFVLARYNTYQLYRCLTCSTTHLWNSLHNEAVLTVKQDRFFYVGFYCYYYFVSLIFVMSLSYGKYWEAVYEEGNEDEGILILSFILLLFIVKWRFFLLSFFSGTI